MNGKGNVCINTNQYPEQPPSQTYVHARARGWKQKLRKESTVVSSWTTNNTIKARTGLKKESKKRIMSTGITKDRRPIGFFFFFPALLSFPVTWAYSFLTSSFLSRIFFTRTPLCFFFNERRDRSYLHCIHTKTNCLHACLHYHCGEL